MDSNATGHATHAVTRLRYDCRGKLERLLGCPGASRQCSCSICLGVPKQGAMDFLNPLLSAGMIERVGTLKNGRYILKPAG